MNPRCQPFLVGHSLGGLIAVRYAEEASPDLPGIALSSPFLRLKMDVPVWKRAAASVLSMVAPSVELPSDIPIELISHDPAVLKRTLKDPLSHRVGTPRWFTETLAAQKRAMELAGSIRTPLALLYAGDDRIADAGTSEKFFDRLTVDKVAHRYAGYYHEIFNEVGRDAVFADLETWLVSRSR